jgi:hypothetical protein
MVILSSYHTLDFGENSFSNYVKNCIRMVKITQGILGVNDVMDGRTNTSNPNFGATQIFVRM